MFFQSQEMPWLLVSLSNRCLQHYNIRKIWLIDIVKISNSTHPRIFVHFTGLYKTPRNMVLLRKWRYFHSILVTCCMALFLSSMGSLDGDDTSSGTHLFSVKLSREHFSSATTLTYDILVAHCYIQDNL